MTFSLFMIMCAAEAKGFGSEEFDFAPATGRRLMDWNRDPVTGESYSSNAKLGAANGEEELGEIWLDDPVTGGRYSSKAKLGNAPRRRWPWNEWTADPATGKSYSSKAKLGAANGEEELGEGWEWTADPATGKSYSSKAKLGAANGEEELGEIWLDDPVTGGRYSSKAKLGNAPRRRQSYRWIADPATGRGYTSQAKLGAGEPELGGDVWAGHGYRARVGHGPRRLVEDVGFFLEPLGPIPDENQHIKPICDSPDHKGKIGSDEFYCYKDLDEIAEVTKARIDEGHPEYVTTSIEHGGNVTSKKKIGEAYFVCHQSEKAGTFNVKHLCHFVTGTFIYLAQAENNGDLKFDIICHDQHDGSQICHPLRSGDLVFLKQ